MVNWRVEHKDWNTGWLGKHQIFARVVEFFPRKTVVVFWGLGLFLGCDAWLGFGEVDDGLGSRWGLKNHHLSEALKWWWGFQPQLFFGVSLRGTWHISKAWMVPGTLKRTESFLQPKIDGWKTESFIFVGWPYFQPKGKLAVSFKECTFPPLFFFFGIVRPNPPSGEHGLRNLRFSPGFSRFEDPMFFFFGTFACNDCLKTN